jgi:hypothetical protein
MHSQQQIDTDRDRIAAHVCPETGRDLKSLGKEAIRSHIHQTFEHAGDSAVAGTDYQRRFDVLAGYFAERFKEAL